MDRSWQNEAAALWLAPLVATVPLIPFFSIPSSPLFLGRLMDDPTHPMNWPRLGPLISAMAVVFDGELLGFLVVLFLVAPIYAGLREYRRNSARKILIVCAAAGLAASQVARAAQNFRQADLRAFANSWVSPVIGCFCGLAAGAFIVYFGKRRLASLPICCTPIAALVISAGTMMWSAGVWRTH
jgi:hypothetical protein